MTEISAGLLATILTGVATLAAAVITAVSSLKVRKEASKIALANQNHEARLSSATKAIEFANAQAHERYSRKVIALIGLSELSGEACYYLERHLTGYTIHQPAGLSNYLSKAEESFEKIMRFRWKNHMFLWDSSASGPLSDIMAAINSIRNSMAANGGSVTQVQVDRFKDVVEPAMKKLRYEIEAELKSKNV